MHVPAEAAFKAVIAHGHSRIGRFVVYSAHQTAIPGRKGAGYSAQITALAERIRHKLQAVKAQVPGIFRLHFPAVFPAKILKGSPPRFIGIGLAGRIGGRGITVAAPVVEDLWDMDIGFLGRSFKNLSRRAKHQIIILCAVKSGAQTQTFHNRSVHHQEMTDIIIRQQQIQVKVRFSVGLVGVLRSPSHLSSTGIQKYGMYSVLFLFFQGAGHFVKSVPGENIVMVKKADIGSLCQFYLPALVFPGNSIIRGQPDVADSLISRLRPFSDTVSRARIRQVSSQQG